MSDGVVSEYLGKCFIDENDIETCQKLNRLPPINIIWIDTWIDCPCYKIFKNTTNIEFIYCCAYFT